MNNLAKYLEPILHIVFWLLFFSSINVKWLFSWVDAYADPNSLSPFSVLIFPLYFYAGAFWLIPKYLNKRDWPKFLLMSGLVFFLPELFRLVLTGFYNSEINYYQELFAKRSLLFGTPSPFFFALNSSIIYRFTLDWFRNKKKIEQLNSSNENQKSTKPYENTAPLSVEDAATMLSKLENLMKVDRLFKDSKLSLRSLASAVGTTDKKLSFVLNQSLSSNFYDYVNKFRVADFKKRLADGDSEKLSLVGLALECGFKSKSSFYRAFKSEVGCSPSAYLKKIS